MSGKDEKNRSHLSPHDRYLRSIMVDPRIAHDFLATHLPALIRSRVDLNTLELQKDSFINDKLRLQISDLLYAVKIQKGPGYIYVLLEHASKPDRLLPFRMLKYMVEIMEYHLIKTKGQTLPVIYPLILYTGQRAFNHSLDVFDLFGDDKAVARVLYTNPFQLVDLTRVSDKELARYDWFRTAALFSKHIHDANILPFLTEAMEMLRKLEKCGEFRYVDLSISYVIEAGRVPDKSVFQKTIINGLTCVKEDKVMILAEEWKREGFELGVQQGMKMNEQFRKEGFEQGMKLSEQSRKEIFEQGLEKGKEQVRAIAKNMLAENISLDLVAKLTGISIKELESF